MLKERRQEQDKNINKNKDQELDVGGDDRQSLSQMVSLTAFLGPDGEHFLM